MNAISRHFSKAFIAGIVAILPIGGMIITIVYLEVTIANSWVQEQWWYFPGEGLLAAIIAIYLIGITVSTFLGKWVWRTFDRILNNLPALGMLYKTLKQVLGYGEGKDGIFQEVVLVPGKDIDCVEIGLVTSSLQDDSGRKMLTVFLPGSPTPTTGRLLVIEAEKVQTVDMPVSEALKALLSVGKTAVTEEMIKNQFNTDN